MAAVLAEALNSVMDRADHTKLPVGRACTTLEKIKLLRESLNSIAAAQALNQNAVAKLVPLSDEIFSINPDCRS